jgi:acyl carrier protein
MNPFTETNPSSSQNLTSEQDILASLREIFVDLKGHSVSYSLNHHLFRDLNLDSMDIMVLIQHIEKTFQIHLPMSEETSLETIADLVSFVQQQITLQKSLQ